MITIKIIRAVKINFLDFFMVQFILIIIPGTNINQRKFALTGSKYPNLGEVVNLQSLERLRRRFRFYEKLWSGEKNLPARLPMPDFCG
jgi:hypothetical protein